MTNTLSVVMFASAGCVAALPPPMPPQFHGAVEVSGGTLGTWTMTPAVGTPAGERDVDAIDFSDPSSPGHVIRIVRVPAEPEQLPRGIVEHVASRSVEIRLATLTDGAKAEVVLTHDHCRVLDAIVRASGGAAFGSARFDCDLGVAGHAHGDIEFAAGSYRGFRPITGYVEATDDTLAHARFEPDQAETDPKGVLFWDHRHPRVIFEVEPMPADTSVLGNGTNAKLHVISTAVPVAPFELASAQCQTLHFDHHQSGYVRVGTNQHTSTAGSIELDCTTPGGGRLTGSLEVNE